MSEPQDDPIAPFARAVLELFGGELRKIRFPDLDHESLAGAVEELKAAQLDAACAEAALTSAREAVRERERLLHAQAARGLSYARIFAGDHPALSARVAEIERLASEGAGSAAPAAGKRRGRPRKQHANAELFEAEEGAPLSADAEAAA